MPLPALPGALAALGFLVLAAALLPARPHLRAALDRLGAPGAAAPRPRGGSPLLRLGDWLHRRAPAPPSGAGVERDLELLGRSPAAFYRDKAVLALGGLLAPLLLGVLGAATGLLPAAPPAGLALGLAVLLWFLPDRRLRREARGAREEAARAVALYLELVAAERRRGAPAAQALETAAGIGTSWLFARVREQLARARLAGTTPWTALTGLSERIGVPELADVAKIIRLSGEEGAAVYETLRGRGRSLRIRLLGDEHARANRASERMTLPLTALAFVFVGIVMTPLVLGLTA
ncbi:MAG: type II secretion system F family protein [Pseudoclavibacter sp.]|nr:type II secretion system F family protein [Pseudoclavibacter sp.]